MPFCTIEEAWGENIYKTSTSIDNNTDYLHSENIVSTGSIENNLGKRSKRKSKKKSSKHTNSNIDDYIKNLKTENDELRNTITHLKENIDQLQMKSGGGLQNNIKMGLIDIILYILTGIFVVFIIDLILKYNNHSTARPINDNIF
jgi:molecular chaperone GrpE (heat shock protein)